jgi:hypothetical protein
MISFSLPYTGAPDAMCPITLAYVHELTHPVAFASNPAQPYELDPLWEWVLASDRHPLTGRRCTVEDISALWFNDEYGSKARETTAALKKAQKTQVFFPLFQKHARRKRWRGDGRLNGWCQRGSYAEAQILE